MTHQDAAVSTAAPVSYAEVRNAGRLSRAALGFILLILAAVGWAGGIPGAPIKAAAAALVVLHAALDRPAGRPLFALSIDAVLLCAAAGMGSSSTAAART
jgi:hypothetical protein